MFRNIYFNSIRHFWKQNLPFGQYEIVTPKKVSAKRLVPNNIVAPDYYMTGIPQNSPLEPEIKNDIQIQKMRTACRIASKILDEAGKQLKVQTTTDEIDGFIHDLILKHKAYPSPLNYRLFPKSICTSINNVACHGIPDSRPLQDGDIINIDITVFHNGYHGDCSKTFPIGNVDEYGIALIQATELCLKDAIEACKPGAPFNVIGSSIERRAKFMGFNVIPSLAGHGIGHYFHGPPDIYHCRNNYQGVMLPGMTFTIEPALTQGTEEILILEDGWTAVTADDARSAQCEHTVLVTHCGVEILTLPPQT